jgi:hypothetical protein
MEPDMNCLESFAAFTAAIFGVITALLVLLSHLEPGLSRHGRIRQTLDLIWPTISSRPSSRPRPPLALFVGPSDANLLITVQVILTR